LSNFALALKNRVCPEIFRCIEYTVLFTFSIFEQLALALKTRVALNFFTVLKYFLSFRIFQQLALTLKFFKPPPRTPMVLLCLYFSHLSILEFGRGAYN